MAIYATIASAQKVQTKTPDGQDLVFLSGYGLFDFKGIGPNWSSDELFIEITDPPWHSLSQVAPIVSLASIDNNGVASNAGWAVDDVTWSLAKGNILELISKIAVRDNDGHIYRVTYQVSALGTLV